MERLVDAGYQFCATDPEGDYESFEGAVILGRSDVAPDPTAILETLRTPAQSVVANLLALPQDDRPAFFASLADATADLSRAAGRPHWLVIDEAHHFLPAGTDARLPAERGSVFMVTTRAELLSPRALEALDAIVAFGDEAPALLASALKRIGADPAPAASSAAPQTGRALFWDGSVVADFQPDAARVRRIRHRRKYAFGSLADSKTFYFRGPEGRLNLRAANLMTFAELAKGVDDDTWLFHLRRGTTRAGSRKWSATRSWRRRRMRSSATRGSRRRRGASASSMRSPHVTRARRSPRFRRGGHWVSQSA